MKLTRQQMEAEMAFHQLAFGYCLKRRRLELHLAQEQFAAQCHVSRAEVQHAEHARHGLRDPTRLCFCIGLGISELELVAEVERVKQTWAIQGFPAEVEVPQTLAATLKGIGDAMKAETTPPSCPSATTPALLYAWMRAFGSTPGR
ncbi:MAG: helix-turn-helix transcriptional regulator [Verrucomicrobiaceae bacterium]|nr:helix-turn-helix transcriptional regulator [Verrucomicrobiaceae bacterium]